MRTRVGAPTLVGGLLVVLVAVATAAVTWLLWTRADDREHAQDERAAQVANEAIQNSVGRVLTSLRASAGLVDARGNVDTASFEAFARAVGSIGVADALALAELVPAAERPRFEALVGRRIVERTRQGTLGAAGPRPLYVPLVAVWPVTGEQSAALGYDLVSDPVRRAALERAQATRSTVLTPAIDFVVGGRGYVALRPVYAPNATADGPVAVVSTRFSMRRLARVFHALPPDIRARLAIDGTQVYSTPDPPDGGVTRSLGLGGRNWTLTASGEPVGHASSLAVLVGGIILMLMLGAFTWTRVSSERKLLRANEAEREARRRSEALERNAARLQARADLLQRLAAALSAAALPNEVAEAAVPFLFEAFAADLGTVGVAWGDDVRTLKVPVSAPDERHWRPVPRTTSTPTADALRGRHVIELHGHDEIARRYPPEVEQLLEDIVSIVVVPLPRQTGAVGVAFAEARVLDDVERALLDAIAEELTKALDRAALLERERHARLAAELLERNATRLAAATTAVDVAGSTLTDLEAFGADLVFVWRLVSPALLEGLASSDVAASIRTRSEEYPLELGGLVSDMMREGRVIAVTAESYDALYPAIAAERERAGLESLVALPLRAASGEVIGAIFAASRRRYWASDERLPLLVGMAEQAGVALERATLFEAEREARRLAELLEENAAHLASAVTVHDVARSTVTDLHRAGFGPAAIHACSDAAIEILAVAGVPEDMLGDTVEALGSAASPAADTLRTEAVVEVVGDEALDDRYPGLATVRERTGVQAVVAVPLRSASRNVLGVLTVGFVDKPWSSSARRDVVLGVAEQCGLAVERAKLYADAVKAADASTFLVRLGESLEWATTVDARARRLVEVLTEERATFAGVHLLDEDGAPSAVVSTGSRPPELADDAHWAELVETAIAVGEEVRPPPAGSPEASTPVVLPLRARGHTLGALTIRSAADEHWAPLMGDELAREVASRAAVILDNAVLYEHEREVSHTLQLGLLGAGPPSFEHITVSAAYRPGTAALEVGGDWYDAFTLPSGAVALVVGDVVGHGLGAAVAMGQLRGAVSALAQTTGPSRLLERLDAFVETVPSAATATLAYVELDPADGGIRYACAGHPPPLVVSPDGRTRFLWEGRSPPLGTMLGDRRADAVDRLDEGETLVLYTDGLVERRSESIDVGLERLARAALLSGGSPATHADDLCDALLGREEQDDDVCVLTVLRISASPLFTHSLRAAPAELAALREGLRAWLVDHQVGEDAERSVVLAISEAAANAIEHAYGCDGEGVVTVKASLGDGRLDVEVRDEGGWRDGPGDGDRGRGLAIMGAIMDRLSVERDNGATVVRMAQTVGQGASV
ncbi:MAG TPA: SpoIIE family protein phosphatase [Gaiella sp.]